MTEEKKEPEKESLINWMIPAVIVIIMIVLFGIVFLTMNNQQFDSAKEKTLQEINNRDVSDCYRQGWIDALDRIDAWFKAPVNATVS